MSRSSLFRFGFALSLIAALFPTSIWAMCCKCQDKALKDATLCLVDTTITSCSDLLGANDKNTNLKTVTCEPTSVGDDYCNTPTGAAQTCTVPPQIAINYSPFVPGLPIEQSALAVPQEPEKPPQLNIALPGVGSQTVISDGAYRVSPWFTSYVAAAYRFLIGASIIVAAIMVTYGGFLYIVKGSIQSVSDGKKYITDALIGLVLVLASATILSTINPLLVAPSSLRLLNINKIQNPALDFKEIERSSKIAKGQIPGPPPASPGSSPPQNPDGPTMPPPEERGTPPVQPPATPTPGASGEASSETTAGCGPGRTAKPNDTMVFNFGWVPPGYEKWYGGAKYQRILVDGRIRNCPGNYPVIFFFHGNQGWHDLETNIGAINSYKLVMNKTIYPKLDYKPFIAVFLASDGKSETLWPGLKFDQLQAAALAELQTHAETKGVGFETVSLAGHSGSGCNKQFWGDEVPKANAYAMLYGDMCMGNYDQNHHPQKSIAIISVMKNNPWTDYIKQHGLVIKGTKCSKTIQAGYSLCAEDPGQNNYFFFENSNNHGWPITLSLEFALRNFFPNN